MRRFKQFILLWCIVFFLGVIVSLFLLVNKYQYAQTIFFTSIGLLFGGCFCMSIIYSILSFAKIYSRKDFIEEDESKEDEYKNIEKIEELLDNQKIRNANKKSVIPLIIFAIIFVAGFSSIAIFFSKNNKQGAIISSVVTFALLILTMIVLSLIHI